MRPCEITRNLADALRHARAMREGIYSLLGWSDLTPAEQGRWLAEAERVTEAL